MSEYRKKLLKGIGFKVPEETIGNHVWRDISEYSKLSEEFIRVFEDKVDWELVCQYQKLSEELIREFQSKVDWYYVSSCHQLSENFIREFKDEVEWHSISEIQVLSDNFVKELSDEIYWEVYFQSREASFDIIKKYITKTTFKTTDEIKTVHLNKVQIREIQRILGIKYLFKV